MTIIAAAMKNGRCAIASDTASTDGSFTVPARHIVNHGKLFKCGDTYLGLSGWSATYDIFESILRHYRKNLDFSSRAAIFDTATRIHKLMKDEYYVETTEDKEQPVESSQILALIANPSGIFDLESYRSVGEYTRYWAIGSGKPLAIGAMYAVYDHYKNPKDIVRTAVEAACEFEEGCGMPLQMRSFAMARNKGKRARK
ncbi:MAG: MFS transporter [Gammaproteobacteria bacterium]